MKPRYEMVSSDVDCVLIRDIGPWDRHLSVTAMVSVVRLAVMPPCLMTKSSGVFNGASEGTFRLIWNKPTAKGVRPTKGTSTACPPRVTVTGTTGRPRGSVPGDGAPVATTGLVMPRPTR